MASPSPTPFASPASASPASASPVLITTPNQYDILCGKGKECNESQGSQRYRMVIDLFRSRYAQALTRTDKMAITHEIYQVLSKSSFRFLKFNYNYNAWEEVSFAAARDKIGHCLRYGMRKASRSSTKSTTSSSSSSSSSSSIKSARAKTSKNAEMNFAASVPSSVPSAPDLSSFKIEVSPLAVLAPSSSIDNLLENILLDKTITSFHRDHEPDQSTSSIMEQLEPTPLFSGQPAAAAAATASSSSSEERRSSFCEVILETRKLLSDIAKLKTDSYQESSSNDHNEACVMDHVASMTEGPGITAPPVSEYSRKTTRGLPARSGGVSSISNDAIFDYSSSHSGIILSRSSCMIGDHPGHEPHHGRASSPPLHVTNHVFGQDPYEATLDVNQSRDDGCGEHGRSITMMINQGSPKSAAAGVLEQHFSSFASCANNNCKHGYLRPKQSH